MYSFAYHGPRRNGQMVALDRYAYGIARSVLLSTLRWFLVGIQFDVTTPLKPFFPCSFIYKKSSRIRRLSATNFQSQFSRFAFPSPISLDEARHRRHSHSPPPPLLHLRKTLAADPSNPLPAPESRPQSS